MATDTLNLVNPFYEAIFESDHDFSADTIKVVLTNSAPTAAMAALSSITEISAGNGYTTGGATATISSSSQTAGTYTLVVADVAWTATGGSIGPFQYAVYYNDSTATPGDSVTDALIGWVDYGTALTLGSGESFTLDHNPTAGLIQAS